MRKLITMLTIVALAFSTTFTSVQAKSLTYAVQQQHLKKDGTPDKRFKENKAPKGPTKKDGTPDMRYKANKATPPPPAKPAKAAKPKKK